VPRAFIFVLFDTVCLHEGHIYKAQIFGENAMLLTVCVFEMTVLFQGVCVLHREG